MKYVYIVMAVDFMMGSNIAAVFFNKDLAEQYIKENKDKCKGYILEIKRFILKCPFCHSNRIDIARGIVPGPAFNIDESKRYFVCKCEECGAMGPMADTEEEAVEEWNKYIKYDM